MTTAEDYERKQSLSYENAQGSPLKRDKAASMILSSENRRKEDMKKKREKEGEKGDSLNGGI